MGRTRPIDHDVELYFAEPSQATHRQYLALRCFLFEGDTADIVAAKYGYTTSTIYTIARNFKARLVNRQVKGGQYRRAKVGHFGGKKIRIIWAIFRLLSAIGFAAVSDDSYNFQSL